MLHTTHNMIYVQWKSEKKRNYSRRKFKFEARWEVNNAEVGYTSKKKTIKANSEEEAENKSKEMNDEREKEWASERFEHGN